MSGLRGFCRKLITLLVFTHTQKLTHMCTGEHTLRSTYFWSSHHLHMHSYMHTHPCNALSTQVYIHRTSCLPLDLPSHTHACAHAHIQTYSSWDGCLSLDLLSHARTHRCARQTTLPAHWLPSNSRQFVELQELHRNSDPFREGWGLSLSWQRLRTPPTYLCVWSCVNVL